MVSPRRRQVIIGGLSAPLLPSVSFATARAAEKLILSGRVLGAKGKPLSGAPLVFGAETVTTDGDGRFFVVTDTRSADGFAGNAQRDADGILRATFSLTLG